MVHYFMCKKIALSLCFSLFLGLLTACTPNDILHLKKNESSQQNNAAKTKKSENPGISTPVALPPAFDKEPPKPGEAGTVYMPNGLPALKPMKGVNVDTLFAENIKDSGERFNRVENAVTDLRKEFETYKPSIVRLAAVESDIQNLIKELEVLLQETPTTQQPMNLTGTSEEEALQEEQPIPQPQAPPDNQVIAQATAPPPTPSPPKAEERVENMAMKEKQTEEEPKKKPPEKLPQYDGIIAKDLRVGEHADKVRVVLDTNKNTDFRIDLDNDEKLIIIELPDARWIGETENTLKDAKLIESYTIEPLNSGKGSMIILSLRKATRIIQEKRLSPDQNNPHHRIYFDLTP